MRKFNFEGRKQRIMQFVKWGLGAELCLLAGSYYAWKRMCQSQEFRFKMKTDYPSILEGFYYVLETVGKDRSCRLEDERTWMNKNAKNS